MLEEGSKDRIAGFELLDTKAVDIDAETVRVGFERRGSWIRNRD